MKRTVYSQDIENRIIAANKGDIFANSDFSDIAESQIIRKNLSRLVNEGIIRRVIHGVYEYPEYNEFLKEYIAPSPDKVAHALARNYGWTIVPCGDTALNILGLSTQVPAVWSYVSDGTYKKYEYEKVIINFKKTTNKEISKISYKTALVIQALKALGKENIDDKVINKISGFLSKDDKIKMLGEAKYATTWIYEIIKNICK
jgi:predicted transcriptional regulator of viral defense system